MQNAERDPLSSLLSSSSLATGLKFLHYPPTHTCFILSSTCLHNKYFFGSLAGRSAAKPSTHYYYEPPVVIGHDNCYTLHSHPSVNHRLCASASPSSSTGLSISDLTRYCRIGCESCYISSDSAISSPICLYTAPQEMLSTIIAPCLSPVLQLPAPPPFAMYIQQVRLTQLPTLKPSLTCWSWISQKRLLVGTLTLVLQKISVSFFQNTL